MRKVELLAPCGNFDCLKAAVNYGADAVYLGGTSFSARAFANNFNHEELVEAVKYCHLRGVKVYMTINTLFNENELEMALNEARFAYEHKVDALIVQDLGLVYRIRQEMPDFDLHASTQMHIHNIAGINVCKKLGFKKVVIARESSLDFIKEACKLDIPIETFIHGAICVSYSGQCLMSSATKNRSANKGACAQCCRLRYGLYENNKRVITDTDYLLSPKDMSLINDIPSLIEAGVSSFKIEGRMKSSAYVGLVTSLYRKAIDSYYKGEKFSLSQKEYNELLSVFNRGFTDSYLKDNKADIFSNFRPNHMGKEIGKVIDYRDSHCLIRLFDNINQFDGIRIISKKGDTGKILNTLTVNKKMVSKAFKNEIISVKVDSPVLKGDMVVRTLDYNLENRINDYKLKKRPIDIKIKFKPNEDIEINAKLDELKYKEIVNERPQEAKKAPISLSDLENIFSKMDNSPFVINKFSGEVGNSFMPKSLLNNIRRNFYEHFEEYILNSFKRSANPFTLDNDIKSDIHTSDITVNEDKLKVINLECDYTSGIICDLGGFDKLVEDKTIVGYYTLNIMNSYAYELVKRLGCDIVVLSSEINNVDDLIENYKKRIGTINPYVVNGKRTLMYLKRNPFIKYSDNNKLVISDGTNLYDVHISDVTRIIERNLHSNDFKNVHKCNIER
ncbi:MAG: U32 family peptidase [Solobacterium sp.]|nr:U32 family peptidase [Solobacterium sp.]